MSGRQRKVLNSLLSCLTGSSSIQLIHLIKRIQHKIGKMRLNCLFDYVQGFIFIFTAFLTWHLSQCLSKIAIIKDDSVKEDKRRPVVKDPSNEILLYLIFLDYFSTKIIINMVVLNDRHLGNLIEQIEIRIAIKFNCQRGICLTFPGYFH